MDNDSGFLNSGGQIIERGTADGVSSIGEEDDGFRAFTTLEVFDSLCQSLPSAVLPLGVSWCSATEAAVGSPDQSLMTETCDANAMTLTRAIPWS